MSYFGSIKVSDRKGWSKTYQLEKAIVTVGSAPFNEIFLSTEHGSGVSPIHLQVFSAVIEGASLRLINLSNAPVICVHAKAVQSSLIPPNRTYLLEDGDQITLGDFSLAFLSAQAGVSFKNRSEHIGLELELSGLQLRKDARLTSIVRLTNFGEQRRCQFELEIEGLPPECYQIDPAPLLYPGGTEQMAIRFFHRNTQPPAGECPFCLRVTSPASYPTEEVTVKAVLEVEPVYQYRVELLPVSSEPLISAIYPRPNEFTPIAPTPASQPSASPAIQEGPPQETQPKPEASPTPAIPQPVSEVPLMAGVTTKTPGQLDPGISAQVSQENQSPSDSNWGEINNNLAQARRTRPVRDLKNVRVMKAVAEPASQPAEPTDASENAEIEDNLS